MEQISGAIGSGADGAATNVEWDSVFGAVGGVSGEATTEVEMASAMGRARTGNGPGIGSGS